MASYWDLGITDQVNIYIKWQDGWVKSATRFSGTNHFLFCVSEVAKNGAGFI